MDIREFQKIVWTHFKKEGRNFPWRETTNPYKIWLSEVMLQQTQTSRVVEKYKEFVKAFPKVSDLANAPLSKVLAMWQGLGYSRRAKNMKRAAAVVATTYKGKFPLDPEKLDEFPGVGPYTARAIYTFATDNPEVFIETNIRSVFIHFFFSDTPSSAGSRHFPLKRGRKNTLISDQEILLKIREMLPKKHFRNWYYALMDYGVYLKKTHARTLNTKSKHYKKQSKFEGSGRQVRSGILKAVVSSEKGVSVAELTKQLPYEISKIKEKIGELLAENFIEERKNRFFVKNGI